MRVHCHASRFAVPAASSPSPSHSECMSCSGLRAWAPGTLPPPPISGVPWPASLSWYGTPCRPGGNPSIVPGGMGGGGLGSPRRCRSTLTPLPKYVVPALPIRDFPAGVQGSSGDLREREGRPGLEGGRHPPPPCIAWPAAPRFLPLAAPGPRGAWAGGFLWEGLVVFF
jgi:hypothetical protein